MVSWVPVVLLAGLLSFANAQTVSNQLNDATVRSGELMRGLYNTIRNVALPSQPLTDDTNIQSRFLLLSPGKVLNYFDYYPGQEYTNFLQVRPTSACSQP